MTNLIESFDISQNFWTVNPATMAVSTFKKFNRSDKSRGKKQSSKMMWAIALLIHPKSKFANASYDDRMNLVNDDYLGTTQNIYPDGKHEDLITAFKKYAMTRIQRIARQWGDKFDERFKFMDNVPYQEDTVDMLDKMMASTDKLWKQYQTCLKDLEDENAHSQVQGGATESLSEQNKI